MRLRAQADLPTCWGAGGGLYPSGHAGDCMRAQAHAIVTARVPVTPLDGGGAVRVGFRVEGLGLGLGVRG